MASQDTPWSSKMFSSSRPPGDAEPQGTNWRTKSPEKTSQGGTRLPRVRKTRQLEALWLQRLMRTARAISSSSGMLCQSQSQRNRGRQVHRREGDMTQVMQGPINDTGEEPLCPRRRIPQNCPCHGCSPTKMIYLDFVFPSALDRFRRHLLPVAAGCLLHAAVFE